MRVNETVKDILLVGVRLRDGEEVGVLEVEGVTVGVRDSEGVTEVDGVGEGVNGASRSQPAGEDVALLLIELVAVGE